MGVRYIEGPDLAASSEKFAEKVTDCNQLKACKRTVVADMKAQMVFSFWGTVETWRCSHEEDLLLK